MIDGVVFDMDGVLLDTERLYRDAWYRVGTPMGLCDIDGCVRACIGRSWQDTLVILRDTYGGDFPAERFRQELRAYVADAIAGKGPPVKPGAGEILSWLKEAGIPVGLATSTGGGTARQELSDAGLLDYFSVLVTGDMIARGKPDPEIYAAACSRLGIRPEESYAVEDSPNGIRSAHGAGLRVLMVPDLVAPTPEISKLMFKTFVSLYEVKAFLETLILSP